MCEADHAGYGGFYAPIVLVRVATTSEGKVRLEVHDSGPGMAQADRQRLGERFFRVLGHAQPGSGLGWSIVRRIAEVSGASVVARSVVLNACEGHGEPDSTDSRREPRKISSLHFLQSIHLTRTPR